MATTTSDTAMLDADIIKQIVFGLAESMLVGKEAVNIKPISGLEYKFTIPDQTSLTAEKIAEGGRGENKNVTWFDVKGSLDKYQVPLFMTDEAIARQMDNIQLSYSMQAAAQGLAEQKDSNIFTALAAGAGQTEAAVAYWDDQVSADPAQDIADAIGKILGNTTIPTSSISDIKLFYPIELFGHLAKPVQVGQIQEAVRDWASHETNISMFATRQMTNDALVVFKADRCAVHLQHDGSAVREFEEYREPGVGNGYLFTQYFDTVVMPTISGGTTSNYICKITGVDA